MELHLVGLVHGGISNWEALVLLRLIPHKMIMNCMVFNYFGVYLMYSIQYGRASLHIRTRWHKYMVMIIQV